MSRRILTGLLCRFCCGAIVVSRALVSLADKPAPAAPETEIGPRAQAALKELQRAIDANHFDQLIDTSLEIRRLDVGKHAVPLLVKQLNSDDADWRDNVLSALSSLSSDAADAVPAVIELHADASQDVYRSAIESLGQIGAPAVPALRRALKSDDAGLRAFAISALGRIGKSAKPAIPRLIELLEQQAVTEEQKNERRRAAGVLGDIGPAARPAADALSRTLNDEDERLWNAACYALAEIGDLPEDSVEALAHVLTNGRPGITFATLESVTLALRRSGAAGQARLVEALVSEDDHAKLLAVQALGRIGPRDKGAVRALRKCLMDSSESVRMEAALALWVIDGQTDVAVPILVEGLDGSDIWAGSVAADYLRRMGPDAEAAAPALLDIAKRGDREVQSYAANALKHIRPRADAVPLLADAVLSKGVVFANSDITEALARIGPVGVGALIKILSHEDSAVRNAAALGLCDADVHGLTAVAALQRVMEKDSDEDVRANARVALKHILWAKIGWNFENMPELLKAVERDPAVREIMATLLGTTEDHVKAALLGMAAKQVEAAIRGLRSDSGRERESAAEDLGRIGPFAADSADALRAGLTDEDVIVRIAAAAALWRITGKDDEALPVLRAGLQHRHDDVQRRAAEALFEIGPPAEATVPLLTEMLKDDDPDQRLAGARALSRVEPDNDELLPALIALLGERYLSQHRATCDVLNLLGPRAQAAIPPLKRCRLYQYPSSLDASTRALQKTFPKTTDKSRDTSRR